MRDSTRAVETALRERGYTRGGYVKGRFLFDAPKGGRVNLSLTQARRLTGIASPKHTAHKAEPAWGDWAMVAALNEGPHGPLEAP
jgi:hypothetical protein